MDWRWFVTRGNKIEKSNHIIFWRISIIFLNCVSIIGILLHKNKVVIYQTAPFIFRDKARIGMKDINSYQNNSLGCNYIVRSFCPIKTVSQLKKLVHPYIEWSI